MIAELDEFAFPEPWWDLRGTGTHEAKQRERLVDELCAELGAAHALAASQFAAMAAFTRQDEALFRLPDDTFLIVHLTQAGKTDQFVTVRSFATWHDARVEIERMASDW